MNSVIRKATVIAIAKPFEEVDGQWTIKIEIRYNDGEEEVFIITLRQVRGSEMITAYFDNNEHLCTATIPSSIRDLKVGDEIEMGVAI